MKAQFVLAMLISFAMIFSLAQNAWPQDGGLNASSAPAEDERRDTAQERRALPVNRPKAIDVSGSRKWVPQLLTNFAQDQRDIWTSPAKIRLLDATWLVPLGGLTAGLFATDRDYSRSLSNNPTTIQHYKTISNAGIAGLVGAGAGLYLFSFPAHNPHWRETGFLAGEAALNSLVVTEALKYSLRRERPYQGDGGGAFFHGGTSFPSEHAAAAWSIAGVIAHEYPGTLPKLVAYGLASTVSFSRIRARQHFPSDVLVGSILGYLVAQSIYTRRHEPQLNGGAWESPREFMEDDRGRSPAFMSSPAVPLDSWIYPALERLAAMGYINTAYVGMRPWTRLECARLVEEAVEKMPPDEFENGGAQGIYRALSAEFVPETARRGGAANEGISLDSVYTRITGISGPPLRDGYHFGQTIINDYGRPYGEGLNNITGLSGHAVAGPLSFDVRAEYQHAPAVPDYALPTQLAIANADGTTPVPNEIGAINQLHVVDASVGLALNNIQISFGKQSLWLGPGASGSLLLSNNADSVMMMKIESVSPFKVPLLSKVLGPIRGEYFLGQLGGAQFELNGSTLLGPGNIKPQPALSGYKASFKPTPNFEFGMGITAQFAGPGLPFTWRNFLRTFYAHNQTGPTANNANPGKRISALDFSYRVPGIRKWLTIYGDTLVVDEISPIGSKRATVNPGIYMPQVPRLPRMEFRAEGLNEPTTSEFAPGFVYYGVRRYRSGYTNEGNLMGNWIGRAGHGGQAWMTYSFSPRNQIQFGYRLQRVSKDFIGGGRSVDFSARTEFTLSPSVALSAFVQYEQWSFPVLSAVAQSNTTASVQLVFYPHWSIRK
jgi:membrane-associated phospholipid phosphatase